MFLFFDTTSILQVIEPVTTLKATGKPQLPSPQPALNTSTIPQLPKNPPYQGGSSSPTARGGPPPTSPQHVNHTATPKKPSLPRRVEQSHCSGRSPPPNSPQHHSPTPTPNNPPYQGGSSSPTARGGPHSPKSHSFSTYRAEPSRSHPSS